MVCGSDVMLILKKPLKHHTLPKTSQRHHKSLNLRWNFNPKASKVLLRFLTVCSRICHFITENKMNILECCFPGHWSQKHHQTLLGHSRFYPLISYPNWLRFQGGIGGLDPDLSSSPMAVEASDFHTTDFLEIVWQWVERTVCTQFQRSSSSTV